MELITAAPWKLDAAYFDGNDDGNPDLPLPPGTIESCDADNIVTLRTDGTGTVDEGPTKCDAGDPQSFEIVWEFTDSEKSINIPGAGIAGLSGEAKILQLTSSKLRLSKTITDPMPATIIVDLKH
jgi:hypothetical protein